jgi:hypothetical protein
VGLELAAGKDGKAVGSENGHYMVENWCDCPPKPGCITVNVRTRCPLLCALPLAGLHGNKSNEHTPSCRMGMALSYTQ